MIAMEPILLQEMEAAARVAGGIFVSGVWQGVVLAACVGLCLRLVPKTTATIRFVVWSAVFVVLAVLPVLRSLGVQAGVTAERGVVHAIHVDVRWSFAIAILWLGMATVRAGRLGMNAIRLRRVWQRALPVITGVRTDLLRIGDGRRTAVLCTSVEVDSPCVIGFFSPRVLVPAELFERLTAAELEQIVLHEMEHLQRGDDWINMLQKIGLVLFPLNPALMWIERRLCLERELACDDGVLRLTKAPKAYATCLTTLAERRLEQRAMALSLGAWERQSELSRRVYSILRRSEGMGHIQTRMVLGGVMVVLLGGAAWLSRCPQLVSFSRADLPISAEVRSLPVGDFKPVLSHSAGAAHETLLKASMPISRPTSGFGLGTASGGFRKQTVKEQSRRAHRPAVQRAKRSVGRALQQWVVLTSWEESRGARMVMTVAREQTSVTSYAAVPTAGGWLVFQL